MTERPAVRISIETDTAGEMRKAVESGLYSYNDQFAGPMENSVLTIGARDAENTIVGGLIANLQPGWKWMTIHRLWIEEAHRGAGIGRRLLEAAEEEARKSGCLHVAVDTMEFQARGFYEKQGYHVYAVQEDYPAGHRKFLLRKTFATLLLLLTLALDYATPAVVSGQSAAAVSCALAEATVIRRQGEDVLQVWELPATAIWFSDTMPDAHGYQAYRSAIRAAGGDDARPLQALTPPKDDADRVIVRNEEHNFGVMYSGGGEVRPIRCLEAALFAFQDARYSELSTPTEFIAHILRQDNRLKVYFGASNGMFVPGSVYGMEHVAADVAKGWQYWALLHNHTVRTIDGKPVPGVPAPSTSDVQFFKAQAERLGLREMWVTNGLYTGVVPFENLHQFRARE